MTGNQWDRRHKNCVLENRLNVIVNIADNIVITRVINVYGLRLNGSSRTASFQRYHA